MGINVNNFRFAAWQDNKNCAPFFIQTKKVDI